MKCANSFACRQILKFEILRGYCVHTTKKFIVNILIFFKTHFTFVENYCWGIMRIIFREILNKKLFFKLNHYHSVNLCNFFFKHASSTIEYAFFVYNWTWNFWRLSQQSSKFYKIYKYLICKINHHFTFLAYTSSSKVYLSFFS